MIEYRYFKCIKAFEVYRSDDNGVILDDEIPVTIEVDTVWEVEFINDRPAWIAYQTNGHGRLMDSKKEHWEDAEYFLEVEEVDE